jgi:molybdopterin synthase catalytic subunit
MKDLRIVATAIEPELLKAELDDFACGALVTFEGWIRNHNEGRSVQRLEYEVYAPLAVKEGKQVLDQAAARWPINHALVVHREGLLELGDVAVWVGVSSPHRDEAFSACRWIIDEVKVRLPIWKKETWTDGDSGWVNCERCAAHAGHDHSIEQKQ